MTPIMPIQPLCVLQAEVLAQQTGVRVMVIGDIGELGNSAAQQHYMLGRRFGVYSWHQLCGGGG